MADEDEVKAFFERSVSTGSKIAGGMVGVAASWALQMPLAGPMIAPLIASGLERVGRDVIARRLSGRQEERVGLAVVLAAQRIAARRNAGEQLRADGFFSEHHAGRAPADEVTEHALNASMNAMEERKIPFLANLLANIAFANDVGLAEAHLLFASAEDASYQQFAIMRAIHPDAASGIASRGNGEKPTPSDDLYPLSAEIYRLFSRGIVEMRVRETDVDSIAFLSPMEADPGVLRFTALGRRLYDLAGIADLDPSDAMLVATTDSMHRLAAYAASTALDSGTF